MITIKWLGLDKYRADMKQAAKRIRPQMRKNLARAAELVVGEAQRHGFQGSRTRARYMIQGGRRVARNPAWPVTSPADKLGVFSGTYRRALSYDIRGHGKQITAEVGPVAIRYARVHEFGIGRMPERPVLGPAIAAKEKQIFAMIGRTFDVLR